MAYRWFCRLGLEGRVPDHSTFSKNRHGRFRDSDLLRRLFEVVLRRCIDAGLAGAEAFAVDASLIKADANRQKGVVVPTFLSPTDPAARWTGADGGLAYFAYSTNYLIDLDHAIIVDVEPSTAVRQAEITATKTMIERAIDRFDLYPERLAADTAYGSAVMLGWLVYEQGIEPHIPVFDKSERKDGTFSRAAFSYDHDLDLYACPGSNELLRRRRNLKERGDGVDEEGFMRYRASKLDCDACSLKSRCCPRAPSRKILRSIHEGARDMARDTATTPEYATSRRLRKKVEMLFAHLKHILRLDRLRLRGEGRVSARRHCPEPAEVGQADPDERAGRGDLRREGPLEHRPDHCVRRAAAVPQASFPTESARCSRRGNPSQSRRWNQSPTAWPR